MALRRRATVLVLGLSLAVQLGAQSQFTKQDGDRCQGKLGRITGFANVPKAKPSAAASAGQMTQLTDTELTSYLRYNLKDQVPTGILDPTLSALGDGRVKGTAVVDLDTVRKQKQRG